MNGKDLIEMGYPEGPVIGIALKVNNYYINDRISLGALHSVLHNPDAHIEDVVLGPVARELIRLEEEGKEYEISDKPYKVWGADLIEENTREQMKQAMSLPVSVRGALMPDSHLGYGLPVGGVLATEDAVIPWAVGVDISCSMKFSLLDIPINDKILNDLREELRDTLIRSTNFGKGGSFKEGRRPQHEVMDSESWNDTPLLQSLKDKGYSQLGTSGSGNHFVEFGFYQDYEDEEGIPPRLAILSHSGSRGVGYKIAEHYSKIAEKKHPKLDKDLRKLAWLSLGSEEGQEYWRSMKLAEAFARANHEVIHEKIVNRLGEKTIWSVFNSHNLAWVEDGKIVHRKGATPAHKGTLGIIPGSMATPAYVVRGRGNAEAINSASHGSGRVMSRRAAFGSLNEEEWRKKMEGLGIDLIGGGLDESPEVYKDPKEVLSRQKDLVEVTGRFDPKIVRMDGGGKR